MNRSLRPFFILWTGQALSLLGSQLVQFALIWHLTVESGSGTVLALASLAGLLPTVLLGPFAGALVDRWPRRQVMFGADVIIALATLVLAYLFASGQVAIWQIYLILFIRALGAAFHNPAMQASTTLMVPKEHLTRIAGLNQALGGGLNIVSAPLGALLVETIAMHQIMLLDVVTALFAIVPLLFIAVPQPPARPDAPVVSRFFDSFREGFHYVWRWPALRMIILIAVALNFLLSPTAALLPLLVTEHFGGGALHLGWLNAVFGGGVVLGGVLLSVWGGFRQRMVTSLSGILMIGAGALGLGLPPAHLFWVAVLAMGVMGFGQPIGNGPLFATLQTAVSPDMQGRVFTMLTSLATAMTPFSLLLAGPMADLIGVRTWYLLAGSLCIMITTWAFTNPTVMSLGEPAIVEPLPVATD